MKFFYKIVFVVVIIFPLGLMAQNNFFTNKNEAAFKTSVPQIRPIVPEKFKAVALNVPALKQFLHSVPMEFSVMSNNNPSILSIPMPDGSINRFSIVESPIQEQALSNKFQDIKTYSGQGIDDRTATIKLDWTGFGFHAQILSPITGSVYIDPYARGNVENYISYFKTDLKPSGTHIEVGVDNVGTQNAITNARTLAGFCFGTQLRTYRLAVACTGEYAAAVGGSNAALVHSAIVTTVNRVNGVYEKELAIRFVLVANNNIIEYLDAGTDPFTGNDNAPVLIGESQSVITSNIGSSNFDIGHTFSTGGGGLASAGVCVTNVKARGITGSSSPTGDAYDIDFVAHEIGHQFGGNHTFNASTGNCAGANRNASTAVEPGSGITIMGYAGICGASNDLAGNSIPFFHSISQIEIGNFSNTGNGSTCAVTTATGNSAPVVNAGADFSIPAGTPFVLTGSATDANGDALTYSWEQIDIGSVGANWNSGSKPFFRSFVPRVSPSRYFPQLSDVANATQTIGEFLPNSSETLNFRLTTRDNKNLGGGVCSDEMVLNTIAGTPFTVTSQAAATSWTANGTNTATIAWNVVGTTSAPFNTVNVAILFSADGGLTFPYTLNASTANDGSESITIPSINTINGRIMVRAVGNVFFNINLGKITVTAASCSAEGATIVPAASVTALVGNAALNLSLNPQYSTPFAASGTITLTDANTNLIIASASATCVQYSNIYHYDVYPFVVSVSGSYTFNRTGAGSVYNFYANSFNPASGCSNWIASNYTDGVGTAAALTVTFVAGTPYFLVQGVFGTNSTTPNTGIPFNYSFAITATPVGGAVFNGSGLYTNPGASFTYGYAIVDNATNNLKAISSSANLSNNVTYPAGEYSVYGLSYLTTHATAIQTFVGSGFAAFTNALASQPNTYCANLSKNSVLVTVNAVVPVTLTGLKARKIGNNVQLEWGTLTENNASHFEIERSADGRNFTSKIGTVNAIGYSTTLRNYGITDNAPLKGWAYYRAKQVDADGKFAYSNIASINFDKQPSQLLIYPNPVKNNLTLEFTSTKNGKIEVQIIDSKGAMVAQKINSVVVGINLNNINVSNLAAGVYIVKCTDINGIISYTKMIKE